MLAHDQLFARFKLVGQNVLGQSFIVEVERVVFTSCVTKLQNTHRVYIKHKKTIKKRIKKNNN